MEGRANLAVEYRVVDNSPAVDTLFLERWMVQRWCSNYPAERGRVKEGEGVVGLALPFPFHCCLCLFSGV